MPELATEELWPAEAAAVVRVEAITDVAGILLAVAIEATWEKYEEAAWVAVAATRYESGHMLLPFLYAVVSVLRVARCSS